MKQTIKKLTKFSIFIIYLSLTLSITSCKAQKKVPQQMTTSNDYPELWKKYNDEIKDGKNQDALKILDSIFALSVKENNDVQVLKTFFKRFNTTGFQEDHVEKQILYVEFNTGLLSTETGQAVSYSYLAELYKLYLNRNAYKLRNATSIKSDEFPLELADYSASQLLAKANEYINLSLTTEETKMVSVESYKPVVENLEGDGKKFRNTIYDLLTFRAISHFTSGNNFIPESTNQFSLFQEEAFAQSKSFLAFNFTASGDSSAIREAVLLYQELERSSMKIKGKQAHFVLSRLQFVHQHSTNPLKNDLYKKSLLREYENISDPDQKIVAGIQLVNHLISMGNRDLGKENHTNTSFLEAMKIVQELKNSSRDKEYQQVFNSLQETLEIAELSINTESVYPLAHDFPISIRYRNVESVTAKIYQISDEQLMEYYQNQYANDANPTGKVIKTFDIELPKVVDYDRSSYEYVLESLPSGNYFVQVKANDKKLSAFNLFHISSLGAIRIGDELQVLDRMTGEPIIAKVEFYKQEWQQRKSMLILAGSANTDSAGRVKIEKSNRNVIPKLITEKETLLTNDNLFVYDNPRNRRNDHLLNFTDRSIYRPGQTIYFKSILYSSELENVISNESLTIELYDANSQMIEAFTRKTNEYGSVNGEFKLPKDLLNGQFSIRISNKQRKLNQRMYIRVEEYKRPTFEVEFETLTETYSFGKEMKFTGLVNTFNGVKMADQEVSYTIERNPVYRWYYSRFYNPSPAKIIANGTVETDVNGKYEIVFTPELPQVKQQYNSYSYTVKAKVTDSRGETRNAEYSVVISDKEFVINTDKQTYVEADEMIDISLVNQNGKSVNETVSLSIYKLQENNRYVIPKMWNSEHHALPKEEYYERTKFYAYTDENTMEGLNTVSTLKSEKITVDSLLKYSIAGLESGIYKIELTSSKADTVEVFVNKAANSHLGRDVFDLNTPTKTTIDKNVEVELSSLHQLQLYSLILRQDFQRQEDKFKLSGKKELTIPISQRDKNGLSAKYYTFFNNRFHQETAFISVTDPQDELSLKWETMRSELYPGSEEKWRLKIMDSKNQVVQAELVASMYDRSLDEFTAHNWASFNSHSTLAHIQVNGLGYRASSCIQWNKETRNYHGLKSLDFPYLNSDIHLFLGGIRPTMTGARYAGVRSKRSGARPEQMEEYSMDGEAMMDEAEMMPASAPSADNSMANTAVEAFKEVDDNDVISKKEKVETNFIRTNLNETVFFKPTLVTNKDGDILLEFTMNEALTEWKLMAFGHTKKLQRVFDTQLIKTKKDLMVFPNGPRFFRIGDQITVPADVRNLSDQSLLAEAKLTIFDLLTDKDVTAEFIKGKQQQNININANSSTTVEWELNIPEGVEGLKYQVTAVADGFKDGEEKTALVVDNRKMVTESKIYVLDGDSTQKLPTEVKKDNTLVSKNYTVSVVSNPSWMAVQSLPYLMEYRYKCTEQIFSRYFSNALAKKVLDENPEIESVYKNWQANNQLNSPLTKTEELKYALLEQSPWVLDALDEEEKMQQLAELFDSERVKAELSANQQIILSRSNGGGLPWFPGGRPNTYITQYILQGFGQLRMLDAIEDNPQLTNFYRNGMRFVEQEINRREREYKSKRISLSPIDVHFMYLTSLFPEIQLQQETKRNINKWINIAKEDWAKYGLLNKGQLALYFHRTEDSALANTILESLRQTSIYKADLGRYWKEVNGHFWYQSNLEAQSMLMIAFHEIAKDTKFVEELKHWLLSNKQTNSWSTTKSTTQAVYAILETGENALASKELITIKGLNSDYIQKSPIKEAVGEYQVRYLDDAIDQVPSQLEVTNPNKHKAWISATHQYVQDMDKIDSYIETPLKLKRELFIKTRTSKGDELVSITGSNQPKIGDEIVIKLTLEVDRPMEFIHIQDSRASGTEPISVISKYLYKNGLYYYEETKDEATNFFLDYLPRGSYSFEYSVYATQKGEFSAGLSTIQSMYAPEFNAHSEGKRIAITGKE